MRMTISIVLQYKNNFSVTLNFLCWYAVEMVKDGTILYILKRFCLEFKRKF